MGGHVGFGDGEEVSGEWREALDEALDLPGAVGVGDEPEDLGEDAFSGLFLAGGVVVEVGLALAVDDPQAFGGAVELDEAELFVVAVGEGESGVGLEDGRPPPSDAKRRQECGSGWKRVSSRAALPRAASTRAT